jgi:hypothetical protein
MQATHPVAVTIPHQLGKDEARRRVKAGLERVCARYPAELKVAEEKWVGDHMSFRVALLGQNTTGTIDFADAELRVNVALSWLMAHQAGDAEAMIKKEGAAMLAAA